MVYKFLTLYLERCSFWHAFAFFQYRSNLEGADLEELREIFVDRQEYMLKLLAKTGKVMVKKLNDNGDDLNQSFQTTQVKTIIDKTQSFFASNSFINTKKSQNLAII